MQNFDVLTINFRLKSVGILVYQFKNDFATIVLKIILLLTLIVNIMRFSNAVNIRKLEMFIY